MNGYQIALYALVVLSVILVCRRPHSSAVRGWAILFLCFIALLGFVGLLTCSRLASELHHASTKEPPSQQWSEGARAARDAAFGTAPFLAAAFIGIALIAAVPWASLPPRREIPTERPAGGPTKPHESGTLVTHALCKTKCKTKGSGNDF